MILDVISKKKFTQQYKTIKTKVYNFGDFGSVEVDFTDNCVHRLRPIDQKSTDLCPIFDRIVVIGTPFQADVWHYLMTIPRGETRSYSQVALEIGRPKACRAVGRAVGSNPVGILIPCHRILSKNKGIGGFEWGIELKRKWLKIENYDN